MTADQLAARNVDFRAALTFAADAQHVIDALEAKAADGVILGQAQRDALATATATFDRYRGFALEIAERNGVDFVSIPVDAYTINYSHDEGRWEGFVSLAA